MLACERFDRKHREIIQRKTIDETDIQILRDLREEIRKSFHAAIRKEEKTLPTDRSVIQNLQISKQIEMERTRSLLEECQKKCGRSIHPIYQNQNLPTRIISTFAHRKICKLAVLNCLSPSHKIAAVGATLYWKTEISLADIQDDLIEFEFEMDEQNTVILDFARRCPNVTSLQLQGFDSLENATLMTLATLYPHLTHLNIEECCQITDVALIMLAKCCPKLVSINLECCYEITDKSILQLAASCRRLRIIKLNYCRFLTDASIMALAENRPSLQRLEFECCPLITDNSILTLAHRCRRLTTLRCHSLIKPETITFLKNHYPHLEVKV